MDGGAIFLFRLFEHQRRPDDRGLQRLHDNRRPCWTVTAPFAEVLAVGPLRDALDAEPHLPLRGRDLSQLPDDDIRGAALGQVAMLLKWADRDDFWAWLPTRPETRRSACRMARVKS